MDFTRILNMQSELDRNIEEAHGVENEDLTNRKLVALIVEIGEFANEIRPFKYWKKTMDINEDHIKEEFVDGIHFFLSLTLKAGGSPVVDPIIVSEDQNIQLSTLFEETSKLNSKFTKEQLAKAFGIYMGMGKLAGLEETEIEKFYIEKNRVNYERVLNGY
ncbi:dUTP diphosphatase [Mycoplasma todarodis]|uniref:dUTP diphosphatase n=1 Tax=Mycoplasma todarodis TaxID=1937191 RepID=A0A4R0XJ71_9MOLU|nr:dUTP diphosphatase [Mycoplasma todarodis]TCG10464.1 dUTP diphosphatase [Mycoplasma todarodis]